MSLHIAYDHKCSGCGAQYVPYDRVPCPRCGRAEAERFDFVSRAVAALRSNQLHWGAYTPGAWWAGSLADWLMQRLFGLLDAYEAVDPQPPFAAFAAEYLSRVEWGEEDHLREHLHGIAVRVRAELERHPLPFKPVPKPFQYQPPVEVSPYLPGWVRCPACGKRFSLSNPSSWAGGRHRTCGQRLGIVQGV